MSQHGHILRRPAEKAGYCAGVTEPFIRPYRVADRADVADICVRTAAAGRLRM
jgi:hypothetical protein